MSLERGREGGRSLNGERRIKDEDRGMGNLNERDKKGGVEKSRI